MEKFIREVLSRLSTADKIRLSYGRASLSVGKLPHHGIREVFVTDGPQGVRRENGEKNTAFPCGLALAASFDTALAEKYGTALAEEARACGIRGILGPGMNLMRTPLNGRSFEYFGEDPVLSGKIAAGYVRGCQSRGVAATPKHLALNNQEICRTTGDSLCDPAVLRELYLENFEIVCKEAKPWMIMTSYNKINGVQASECSYTQRKFLRDECGFDGVTVSDWGGTQNAKNSILGGQDLEMGGGEHTLMSQNLSQLVEQGEVPMEVLDQMALNNLRLLYRMGAFAKEEDTGGYEANSPEYQEFVRRAACECAVLLKNDGNILPGNFSKLQKIAIIGPSADYRHNMGSMIWCGGSGATHPPYEVTVLEAARKRWGGNAEIIFARGVSFDLERTVGDAMAPDGFAVEYFDSREAMEENRTPFLTRQEVFPLRFGVLNAGGMQEDERFAGCFACRIRGRVVPRKSGKAAIQLATACFFAKFIVNHQEIKIADTETVNSGSSPLYSFEAVAGVELEIEIEAYRYTTLVSELRLLYFEDGESEMAEAVRAAAEADTVIYVGGTHHGYDKEAIGWGNVAGADIPDLELPSNQDELLKRLAEVNSNMTVVLINGSVVNTSQWIEKVPAVLEMFYPGQECGNSVLDILEGKASPNGRLPFSWSDRLSDYPSIANGNYPGIVTGENPQVSYDEGLFIGYRYMDKAGIRPRFPFGYGLSYASFEYEMPEIKKTAETEFEMRVRVKNVSPFAGACVIQIYVGREDNLPERPARVLRHFKKVHLAPGEEKIADFKLVQRDFSRYDAEKETFCAVPGKYEISAGIDARTFFAVTEVEVG